MYTRINRILKPLFISTTTCDVVEETALKAAGITTQPISCKFVFEKEYLLFKIKGLTEQDCVKFLFFLVKCGDEQAIHEVHAGVSSFQVIAKNVEEKFMTQFMQTFATLPKSVIEGYQLQSVGTSAVVEYKHELLNANDYPSLKNELAEILSPHYISEEKSGIFIRTLLKLAGVSSNPDACQFGPYDEKNMFFRIKGLTLEDNIRFMHFMKETGQDEQAFYQHVTQNSQLAVNNRPELLPDTDEFVIDKKCGRTILLPLFKKAFDNFNELTIREYKHTSLGDPHIVYTISEDIRRKREELEQLIEPFLWPKLINLKTCSIFEESILKLANIKENPSSCESSPTNKTRMTFSYQGLTFSAASTLLRFLETIEGAGASSSVSQEMGGVASYDFFVNIDAVKNKLIPAFMEYVDTLSDDQLANYRNKSDDHIMVCAFRLMHIWNSIIACAQELEVNCIDQFLKGSIHALNIVINSINEILNDENSNEYSIGSSFDDESSERLALPTLAAKSYEVLLEKNPALKNETKAKELQHKFTEFVDTTAKVLAFKQFGLFRLDSNQPINEKFLAKEIDVTQNPLTLRS